MYYKNKETAGMGTRKLMTISLPPPLLKKAEEVAQEENRTKSELLREALRFYVETKDVRKKASREQLFALIGQIQSRTHGTPSREIRTLVREAIGAARRQRRLSHA
jgi:metal-responsive CopG/Arc/MetJ family transcriptional regulator